MVLRARDGDSEDFDPRSIRQRTSGVSIIQTTIGAVALLASVAALYADNVSKHAVVDQKIQQIQKQRNDDHDGAKIDRREIRDELKEVKGDVKELKQDINKVLIELQKQRR